MLFCRKPALVDQRHNHRILNIDPDKGWLSFLTCASPRLFRICLICSTFRTPDIPRLTTRIPPPWTTQTTVYSGLPSGLTMPTLVHLAYMPLVHWYEPLLPEFSSTGCHLSYYSAVPHVLELPEIRQANMLFHLPSSSPSASSSLSTQLRSLTAPKMAQRCM